MQAVGVFPIGVVGVAEQGDIRPRLTCRQIQTVEGVFHFMQVSVGEIKPLAAQGLLTDGDAARPEIAVAGDGVKHAVGVFIRHVLHLPQTVAEKDHVSGGGLLFYCLTQAMLSAVDIRYHQNPHTAPLLSHNYGFNHIQYNTIAVALQPPDKGGHGMKGMHISEQQAQELLKMAAQRLGTTPEALAKTLNTDGGNLPPQVAALMQDQSRLEAILQQPAVKELLDKLGG